MLIRRAPDFSENEITDPDTYLRRREFIQNAAFTGLAITSSLPLFSGCMAERDARALDHSTGRPLPYFTTAEAPYRVDEVLTPKRDITTYNNFYELGTGKGDPAENAHFLRSEPWSVKITGEVAKPGKVGLEDLLKGHPLQERIYRLRCVEAWSMVVPWVGIPLGDLLKRFEPNSNARYVTFETLYDPEQLPGQRRNVLDWPYREGLRIDEALHPLTLLAVGLYGESLPGQNGAPLRLVVPWKYGFKSIKSIVRIGFQKEKPETSWHRSAPHEYGFYANVNPDVSHPRWSQARERRVGEWRKRPTLPFNGYADQVADLYAGMDLRKHF